ncbi:MAG TPA: LuxR C-terminal-related transcriptional regulator [Ktedonobacterales bacterium]
MIDQRTPEAPMPLEVGSAEWFAWLEKVNTFFFKETAHPFTARKQLRSGHWYWYAQRRHKGRLRSVYMGKTADLTLERLRSVAQTLMVKEAPPGPSSASAPEPGDSLQMSNGRGKGPPPALASRLAIPRLRPTWVRRSRASDYLERVLEHPLTLVSAPNGFGKTTVLAQWAALVGPAVAWVSLEESERDPGRFWTAVLTALDHLAPGMKRQALKQAPAPAPSQQVLMALCKAAAKNQHPLLLMLDNYSELQEAGAAIHEGMMFLVEHLPPQVHIVLAGRRDPPLPLARLRGHGYLYEVRVAELRFTSEEAAEFFTKQLGVPLAAQDVAALHARTEGWAIGLQLAAQALKGEANLPNAIASFTGEHPYVVDFLSEEVLKKLPTAIQQFLLETSVLDQLNGALCEAITGVSNSQEVLETLAQAGLFVLPIEDSPQSYRFHPLFGEVLRLRLQQSQPERVSELRLRASEWHEGQGNTAEAIEYAFAGGDLVRAARLMEESAEEWLGTGALAEFQRWLKRLPDDLISRWPHLCVAQAQLLLAGGQLDAFEHALREIDHHLKYTRGWYNQEEQALLEQEFLTLRAARAALQGHLLQAVAWGSQAVAALPEKHSLRHLALLTLGDTLRLVGDTQAAGQMLEDVCKASETRETSYYFASIPSLALVYLHQGRLQAAQELCQRAALQAEQSGNALERQNAALALGMVLYERNELEAAEAALEQSIRLRPTPHSLLVLTVGYSLLAFIRQARGDAAGALQLLEQARMEVEEKWPWALSVIHAHQARLHIAQGNLAAANTWRHDSQRGQQAEQSMVQQGFVDFWEEEQLVLAERALAQEHPQEALKLVDRQCQQARAAGRMGHVLACLVLEAAAYESAHLTSSALQALEQALALAEPEGYVRTFLLGAAPVQRLLKLLYVTRKGLPQAETFKFSSRSLETLLGAFQREEDRWNSVAEYAKTAPSLSAGRLKARLVPLAPLVEPLSEREQEILRFVEQGASNQEIAHRLAIALSTVKRHLSNIYGKLGVRSRTQALALVQSLHLLAKTQAD